MERCSSSSCFITGFFSERAPKKDQLKRQEYSGELVFLLPACKCLSRACACVQGVQGAVGVNHSVAVRPVEARGQRRSRTRTGSSWTSPGCSCQLIPLREGKEETGGKRRGEEKKLAGVDGTGEERRGERGVGGSPRWLTVTLGRSVREIKEATLLPHPLSPPRLSLSLPPSCQS